ncbi:hypothetical protein P9869_42730 [Streptomyces ossamyceticus]|nr:hypothetical protein [Streptomyces ossamyceticus]
MRDVVVTGQVVHRAVDDGPAATAARASKTEVKHHALFAAIRTYLATAARQDQPMLDVLVQAMRGSPRMPATV